MFQILSIIGIVLALVLVPLQLRARAKSYSGIVGYAPRLPFIERMLYLAMLLGLLLLAGTGLTVGILGMSPMHQWLLILHVAGGPLFAIGMAGLAIAWANARQYNPAPGPREIEGGAKLLFWLMLLAALVALVSAVTPMLPLLGTHGQHLFYEIHRYSSLVTFILVLLHFFRFAAAK